MKRNFKLQSMFMSGIFAGFLVLAAGSTGDEGVKPTPNEPSANDVLNIPKDEDATDAPVVETPNATLPNAQMSVCEQDGFQYMSIDMTGVWDASANSWLELSGTNKNDQNVWVSVDGIAKGVDVYNNAVDNSRRLLADVVFIVDNSGSMSEEADAVAKSIVNWANILSQSGLDTRVGCVGYSVSGYINGAINMTTADELSSFLNYGTGTKRTMHFGGADADDLRAKANNWATVSDECGAMAIWFADEYFNFRGGANRIYVNFTDEPNQPRNNADYSVESFNPEKEGCKWTSSKGTIHTVFSDPSGENYCRWQELWDERPWDMSTYTGGTKIFTDGRFADFTLENLPVTGAMQNSYVLRITNLGSLLDGNEHSITITVYTNGGTVMAVKTFVFKYVK